MATEADILARYDRDIGTVPHLVELIAGEEHCSVHTIYLILRRNGRGQKDKPPPAKPQKLRARGGGQRHFVSAEIDPSRAIGLPEGHAALVEGRTLFPTKVVKAMESPRFLVSGKNNPKTGALVIKGAWRGWPIYTLTLEERRTCPASCHMWAACYGNAMHHPRRADAFDPDFIPALAAEVITKAREHPEGFVVRLHVLGDFYSVAYVHAWGRLLDMLPSLHVFGYTNRKADDPDPETRAIAAAIAELTEAHWDRFAIRTSHTEPGPSRAIVVDSAKVGPNTIVCPAQLHDAECCATCGLCWASAARPKTIAFLRHGKKAGPKK